MFRYLKTAIGNAFPEVKILACFVVFERDIADNTEGNERCIMDVADLGNRTTLHVNGCCIGEFVNDLLHLFL